MASNAIKAPENNYRSWEYSAIVYVVNGVVGWTAPYTDRDPNSVNFLGALGSVPDGAVIVEIVHSHPEDPQTPDTIPSGVGMHEGEDWESYDTIVNWNDNHSASQDLPRGITVDPNMLLYILSDEDGGKTHVYDKTDKNQTIPSCTLE
jgi:hypothetical protein